MWTVLKNGGFKHPQNKTKINGIHIHKGYICYPDFYKGKQFDTRPSEEDMKDNFILDAKYKRGSYENNFDEIRSSIQREDLHQIITYLHILPANAGGLIYPYDGAQLGSIIPSDNVRVLYGYGGSIRTYGIKIPQNVDSYKTFVELMNKMEKELEDYNWS